MIVTSLLLIQSLWGDGGADPYDAPKRKPFKVHDLVKVVVNERTRAAARSDLKTDKRTRWETEFDKFIKFDVSAKGHRRLRAAELADDPSIDIDARFRQDDLGRTNRDFQLTFNITAEIVQVYENQNCVIQAMRKRKINEEEEVIRLTGVISPVAIKDGSIVSSDDIANLNLSYDGSGSVSDASKQGWLGKLLSKFWPF